MVRSLAPAALLALLGGCVAATAQPPPVAQQQSPVVWPNVRSLVARDAATERQIDAILRSMTLEDKVAQMIQPDIGSITPEDVRRYRFGSILNGGNSAPNKNETGPASDYLNLADQMWDAAMDTSGGRRPIPMLWGTDAVHGHSNVVGATIFPHNIGLGATRNPELIRRVGEITALEVAVTGIDWTFAPTLAVVRDDRWGRTYEGYSEDPQVVRMLAGAMVEGLQGRARTRDFLGPARVLATAKHFVGDGGTLNGKDQGDNPSTDEQLRDMHGAGYPPAIRAGVQTVMVSYSSVRGQKMHGHRDLLTGALKRDMRFDGLLVGDWNGHGQVPGCTNTSCPAAVNAGLDMFMAPDSWKGLYENTLAQVRSGAIPADRINDAVRRILRVKFRAGLFSRGRPSSRPWAGRFELLGAPAHRAVARDAVRRSAVLLKNQGRLLPLRPRSRVLVAGDGADNIPKQSGGWTLTWQGTDTKNTDFPNAQSIYGGIRQAVRAAGGSVALNVEGKFTRKPDVAIVVFGENPYAEMEGDRPNLEYSPGSKKDLALLKRLKAAGIPVVSVFLSGRPLWVTPEMESSDAFVAAFLPGSEGGGIADLLFRAANGSVPHDFTGRLSFSWPATPLQTPLNYGQPGYAPLFPLGFGLSYSQASAAK